MTNQFILPFLLLAIGASKSTSQVAEGRWSLGLRGGINVLQNDFNVQKVGSNIEVIGRYGFSKSWSVGASFGYEELKSHQVPDTLPLPFDYVRLDAFPISLTAWFHPMQGKKISPFLYAGMGAMVYRRWDGSMYVPDGWNTSVHLPVGIGVETSLTRALTLTVDASYRFLDDMTETYSRGGPDSYVGLKAGINLYVGTSDADDEDNDGLTNGEERLLGTNPQVADTDGDGLTDGEEMRRYATSPLNLDTDDDGISDYEEILTTKTNPGLPDSDEDGINDGDEMAAGLNPLSVDTDGDGLNDGEEAGFGSSPSAFDSDGDSLSDWAEVKTYQTSPINKDTDGDGLDDGEEILRFKSNPLSADTDGGGVNDGAEVARGSDPTILQDDALKFSMTLDPSRPLVLEGLNFEPGSAKISRGSETTLENAFVSLVVSTYEVIDIVGHTDIRGNEEENERLSLARAEAVKAWLVGNGLPAKRLRAIGMGSREAIASNDTPEGRAKNRRVEIRVRN
jgi:outer membrane protein OmpA-like peptidoglycan-associated protein